jgi:hypothetical protein
VECPTGSGRHLTLYQVAEELTRRLAATFRRDEIIARAMHLFATTTPAQVLELGKIAAVAEVAYT